MDVLLQNFSQEIAGDMSGLLFFIIYFIPSGMLHDSLHIVLGKGEIDGLHHQHLAGDGEADA